jgi:hypothetical protein
MSPRLPPPPSEVVKSGQVFESSESQGFLFPRCLMDRYPLLGSSSRFFISQIVMLVQVLVALYVGGGEVQAIPPIPAETLHVGGGAQRESTCTCICLLEEKGEEFT